MDTAVRHDIEAWRRFTSGATHQEVPRAGRAPRHRGSGPRALLRCQSAANVDEILVEATS
ncbi:MAG: hypothetical protein ACLTMP_07925 [Eggerthella lenta]